MQIESTFGVLKQLERGPGRPAIRGPGHPGIHGSGRRAIRGRVSRRARRAHRRGSDGRLRRTLTAAVAVLGCQAWQWCAAAEHVVLETNAAAYSVGQILEDQASVALAESEFLVAISEEGTSLRVDGPFEGPLDGLPPAEIEIGDVLAELVGGPRSSVEGLGGIRGPGEDDEDAVVDTRPSPWLVHAGLTGDQCVLGGEPATLWREVADPAGEFQITAAASGRSARLDWPSAEQRARWPEALPREERALYLIRPLGKLRSTAVRLHELNPALADAEWATVAWLAAKGCMGQARLLLAAQ